ncbi:MFS transporter [Rummeliibacillus suwonensis]|uniref:MFS transporter n=1 Tax=Rummeliibacillus suwonensis TaxID=1306154 RepID=UPI0011B4ECBB|nr:MFS transporter [Rummeliibacillus suwonensis]
MEESLKVKKATYQLWTFTISKIISTLGANVLAFGISLYILKMTGSATSFAMNMVCSILPRVLLASIVGLMADRYSKKMIILLSQGCTVVLMAGLLVYGYLSGITVTSIYIVTALYSITSTFNSVTFTSSIACLVDRTRIQKAMSFNQMAMSIAAIGGPAIGGMMYGFVSIEGFLIVHMVAYLIALLLEATMNFHLYSEVKNEAKDEVRIWQSLKDGFQYAQTKKAVATILWVAFWINLFFTAMNVGGIFILVEVLKIKSRHVGIIESAGAIGMLVASVFLSTRKPSTYPLLQSKRYILWMATALGLATIPLWVEFTYMMNFLFFITLFFSFSAFAVFINTPVGVMIQTEVEESYRGRIFGILEAVSMAMMPLGTMVFGLLFDRVDPQWVLLGSSMILIVITSYMMRSSVIQQIYPQLTSSKSHIKEKVQHL